MAEKVTYAADILVNGNKELVLKRREIVAVREMLT